MFLFRYLLYFSCYSFGHGQTVSLRHKKKTPQQQQKNSNRTLNKNKAERKMSPATRKQNPCVPRLEPKDTHTPLFFFLQCHMQSKHNRFVWKKKCLKLHWRRGVGGELKLKNRTSKIFLKDLFFSKGKSRKKSMQLFFNTAPFFYINIMN